MDHSRKLQLLQERITAAKNGSPENLSDWRNQTEVVLRTVMGQDSKVYENFKAVRYTPGIYTTNTDFSPYVRAGVMKAVSVLKAATTELELLEETKQAEISNAVEEVIEVDDKGAETAGRIFIVHGHDDARKFQLARFLRDLTGHEPVILHEQPNKGAVLIEKLEASAEGTGFAVVLLTADDTGKANKEKDFKPRGRQNVVFELGFFMAALGRKRVAVLMDPGVEEPGDVKGLVYTALDSAGAWKAALATEIEEAGIPVEWKALRR